MAEPTPLEVTSLEDNSAILDDDILDQVEEPMEKEQEDSSTTKSSKWKYNELVWAKIVGYPYWPAIVVDPEKAPATVLETQHTQSQTLVRFFGDSSYGWLDDIINYKENFNECTKKSSKALKTAIREAEEYESTGVFPQRDSQDVDPALDDFDAILDEEQESDDEEEGAKKRKRIKKLKTTEKKRKRLKPMKSSNDDEDEDLLLESSDEEVDLSSLKKKKTKKATTKVQKAATPTPKKTGVSKKKRVLQKEIYELVGDVTKSYKEEDLERSLDLLKKIDPFSTVMNPDNGKMEKTVYCKLLADDLKVTRLGKLVHVLSHSSHQDIAEYAKRLHSFYMNVVKKELMEEKVKKSKEKWRQIREAPKKKEEENKEVEGENKEVGEENKETEVENREGEMVVDAKKEEEEIKVDEDKEEENKEKEDIKEDAKEEEDIKDEQVPNES